MALKYLPTAAHGLKWMRRYYRENPQLDIKAASAALKRAEQTLAEFPFSGERYEDFETVREHRISGTSFSLLYTVSAETIMIIDLRDVRGNRSAEALREFNKTVRRENSL
ncbi:hypothetical protein GJ654_05555 [Rhodoblastus acidophilus]|jgi:hypothetical protein|uniref:Type II toxin-antitoxin system RelE/ParE family toxin n=1 Tax=Rhodoblastus acidophilus TaxID=1074 RepID=A0A6N8DKT1_RHOAC|nr:type II toxin-antitoxin system RelE/ParE family toxin [Rhodoblastus acidophilus]MCW2273458.1 hypothetical protein [Rhodoblastus acidophilus]MTV30456.1 hypothetical protein [Rhodoblastus acidophilus]